MASLSRQLIPEPILRPAYRIYEARLRQRLGSTRPGHVAVILDGHRRFARAEGMADYATSYRAGMAKFLELAGWAAELDINAVTGWLLSTDNLRRPEEELTEYYQVLIEMLQELPRVAAANGFRIRCIGSLDLLPESLRSAAKQAQENSVDGSRHLIIALGYGGRQEIVDACRDLVRELDLGGKTAGEIADAITAESLADHLYTPDVPDPDLVIRTSGESRLSGFLLWQAAYSEYVFVDVYWPAFRRVDFLRALRQYSMRERRFGQ
jgi:short-chain Z-isoprenyl diphosphate synthase